MIEIPALEQPAYDQRELDQLQEQYNQLSVDSPDDALSDNTIRDFSGQEIMGPPAQTDQSHSSDQFAQTADHQHGLEEEAIPDLEPREPDLQPEIHTEIRPAHQLQTDLADRLQTDFAHQLQTDLADPGLETDLYPEPASLPLAHMAHSPMAVDLYFLAQTRTAELSGEPYSSHESQNGFGVDPMPPKDDEALYLSAGAFMIRRNPIHASNVSLQLSDYARELESNPQPSTAEPLEIMSDATPSLRKMAPNTLPPLDSPVAMELVSDFEDDSAHDLADAVLGSQILDQAPKPALAKPFTSPRFVEPSPQLPPPLSAKSLRLAFPLNEEYAQVRKAAATEPKNPAEYTLHIVFTQFVRHAERKLNFCLEYPLLHEPPIIELLAEGVDPQFDNIVASLGYIAKRKPKPVIDSVMFWRKSKSEVAAMAAAEVERVVSLSHSRSSGDPVRAPDSSLVNSPSQVLPKAGWKGKRSLSLMRTKSLSKFAHRRNNSAAASLDTVNTSIQAENSPSTGQKGYYEEQVTLARETAIQAERKSLASIYILCRVLIEVVKQTSYETMGEDLGGKLEEIVYTQLKTTDPVSASESFVRLANWNLFAELLGFISEKSFLTVSDRFIADLEKVPPNVKHEEEPHLHLLIHGMRYLKLTNYPLEKFEESADFLQSLTKFFCNTQNQTIIFAYADVLSNLIFPLASVLTAEANHPLWVEAITKIYNKLHSLWTIADSMLFSSQSSFSSSNGGFSHLNINDWGTSLNLMTSSLLVAPKEIFSDKWFQIVESSATKLKPKVDTEVKTKMMISISRLLWTYINRLPDTLNNTIKKLDSLFDILFFSSNVAGKKQQWIALDNHLINAISEIIRIAGFQHFNYVLENVILRLLRSSFNGLSLENISAEKLIIVIKAYMLCLKDYKLGERPELPSDKVLNDLYTEVVTNADQKRKPFHKTVEKTIDHNSLKWNRLMFDQRRTQNLAAHEDICKTFVSLLKLLDSNCGATSWVKGESYSSMDYVKPLSGLSNFHFGIDFSVLSTRDVQLNLFATLIDAAAWSIVPLSSDSGPSLMGISFKSIVEIFVRNSIHENEVVASASVNALAKLASRNNAGHFLTTYARIAFRFTDKPGPSYETDYFNSEEFIKLLRVYVELLKCWLNQFNEDDSASDALDNEREDMMDNEMLNDLYQINHKAPDLTNLEPLSNLKPYDKLEWKAIITIIEEVEGNGLFFLCSHDSRIRLIAISILKLVEQFDQSIYNSTEKDNSPSPSHAESSRGHSRSSSKYVADEGTRLIQVMENQDFFELIKSVRKELSVPERNRLSKLKSKKGIMLKFAASDYGIDSTIWFRVFPRLLEIFFERCPMPVALCRSIVCVRLVQMHELVVEFSQNYKNYTSSLFGKAASSTPPEVLVDQWKLYLIFACCSLTSTNDQKISFPSKPTHGRKKSLPMYIQHQKITSAKSVFRMALPLLKSQQNMIRDAVIEGLSSVNVNTCRSLAENLPVSLNDWEINNTKRDPFEDRIRIEVVHILSIITSRFKADSMLYADALTVANLVSLIKNVKAFLSKSYVQTQPEFQSLRCYFSALLENVFCGLKDKPDLNRWLPFEARIGCFNFLKEWCGYGDSKTIFEERYAIMKQKVTQQKEPMTAVAILELEKKALQSASLSCMATICSGTLKQTLNVPGKVAVISFDSKSVMDWVYEIICSDNEKLQVIGKTALKNILTSNINSEEIYHEVLKQCYNPENSSRIKEIYYTNLVNTFISHKQLDLMPFDIFCLSTFFVGADNYEIRFAAIKLIKFVANKFLPTSSTDKFTESVYCSTVVVYKKVLFEISVHLASAHSKDAFTYISYLTKYFNAVDNSTRRDILACLLPWVQTVELKYLNEEGVASKDAVDVNDASVPFASPGEIDTASLMVLNNLFEITVKFSKKISNEVEALWVALGTYPRNSDIIFGYIIGTCLEKRNPSFVSYSRQIIAYLVFSKPDLSYIVDKLIANLEPKAMVPPSAKPKPANVMELNETFPYSANLKDLLPLNGKESAFSLGQLSMVFLVDLLRSNSEIIMEHLPLLLHVSFSLLDHYFTLVQEQAVSLLIHLVHLIAPGNPKSARILDLLRQKDHQKNLWVYDDLNNDKKGGMTPKNMDLLVRYILEVFAPTIPNLQTDWSRVCLKWATTCAVRHIACRSFQVFRSLLSFLDQNMLKDMLHRLSNTIADEAVEIQGFAMQILMTLNAITAELDSEKLIDFPQLFWSGVACLSTVHEHEFIETISTMSKFVSKIDLDAPDTISCLIATFPSKWEGKFEGLQELVLVGLRSATAWEPTIKFLDKLNRLKDSDIIGSGDSRLLTSLIANFPRFLHALDQKKITLEIEEACLLIGNMATNNGKPGIARILNSLAKNRFRSKKDFLVQTISSIRSSFFPEYESQALILLLSFLSNKLGWIKLETLGILKYVFPYVNLQREEFIGVGADLISPLLRLLLTEYAEPSLEVIEEAVMISGSQLDKDFLRMSMGTTSMKKEYEKTVSLFGIPEDSGWAIPMPAITASNTRNNVHAVFATCGESTVVDERRQDSIGEEIHFLMEDYYEPTSDNGDNVSMGVEEPAASLSNMWAALDDFDSFFTKPSDTRGHHSSRVPAKRVDKTYHAHSVSMDTNSSDLTSPIDSVPQVYDNKALVILNRSLARTQSNTSFKSSLADNYGSPTHYGISEGTATKRSYIPFRNSRLSRKVEMNVTPKMTSGASVFEQSASSPASRMSLKTSPQFLNLHTNSPQEPVSPESNNPDSKRLDLLLNGRKRNKRTQGM